MTTTTRKKVSSRILGTKGIKKKAKVQLVEVRTRIEALLDNFNNIMSVNAADSRLQELVEKRDKLYQQENMLLSLLKYYK